MPFRIVRNDITQMNTQAIVNTANRYVTVGAGCDMAIYNAAGYDELIAYRANNIGEVPEGEVFITPGFNLRSEFIIHAVSPMYINGDEREEELLRSCYRKSLQLAYERAIRSIAFPLISTGSFGYPKEEGMRIAVDEINAFLLHHNMLIYLVVFDDKTTSLGSRIYPDLEEYIDQNYADNKRVEEYGAGLYRRNMRSEKRTFGRAKGAGSVPSISDKLFAPQSVCFGSSNMMDAEDYVPFEENHEKKLQARLSHLSDTFSQYLLFLIQDKNMENADVYKRAIVDKKTFSKIKNNVDYHPQKLTALCLCIGARLNIDESKDLLARAGYALSPCDMTDIIFSYFIENEIYDMIELDIQLEEHGLPCIIS